MKSMNRVFKGMVLMMAAGPAAAFAGPLPPPELVDVQSEQIFAPPGFDSNDVAQVVVHGEYNNTCYRSAMSQVAIDRELRVITVAPKAYLRTSCWCAPVRVSFTQPIELGILNPGKYRVVEFDSRGGVLHETTLSIASNDNPSPDDFLYAPTKSAQVVQNGPARELVLSGTFNSECMELQEVRTLHRAYNVIEVLPIVSYKTGTGCDNAKARDFEARVKLPATEPGDTLLHVRLLNGQALNLVEPF